MAIHSIRQFTQSAQWPAAVQAPGTQRPLAFSATALQPARLIQPAQANTSPQGNVPVFDLETLKSQLLAVKDDPKARLQTARPLLDALHEYGAIRIANHGVEISLVDQVRDNIQAFLSLPYETLKNFREPLIAAFRGVNVKPDDTKRVFSIGYRDNVAPKGYEAITEDGQQLYEALTSASKDMLEVLSLIYEGRPDGVFTRLSLRQTDAQPEPVIDEATLRQIYYPSNQQLAADGVAPKDNLHGKTVRLRPHLDYGLITLLPASKESGLWILPHSIGKQLHNEADVRKVPLNQWVQLESEPGELLVQIGRQMDIATHKMAEPISATWHTVLANAQQLASPRSSTAFFVESKSAPTPDLRGTLDANQHVTATYQFEGREPFAVTSLYKLMLEKWLSESPPNRKALDADGRPVPEAEFLKRYGPDFSKTVQQAARNNKNLSYIA